jgi:hypothetical protein
MQDVMLAYKCERSVDESAGVPEVRIIVENRDSIPATGVEVNWKYR